MLQCLRLNLCSPSHATVTYTCCQELCQCLEGRAQQAAAVHVSSWQAACVQAARDVLQGTYQLLLESSSDPVKFCAALHHALDISAVWAWRSNSLGDECLDAVLQLAASLQAQGQLPEVRTLPCSQEWGQRMWRGT